MAVTQYSDLKVYNPQIQSGLVETLQQVSDGFNAASRGAIQLNGTRWPGHYVYSAFWSLINNMVTRRDITSTSAATPLKASQAEKVSVKLNRKFGPVDATLDSFKKIGQGSGLDEMDFLIGTQIAKAMQIDMLDTILLAARAALNNQSTVKYTIAANGTMTTDGLVKALAKRGDAATDVAVWVMHSKPYYDLLSAQIAANITGVSNLNVAAATPVTLNRPVLVTDSPSLVVTGGTSNTPTTDYMTLGLVPGACVVEDSEEESVVRDFVTGNENLIVRLQGEYAYNIGIAGFTWDVQNGGLNPSSSAVGTGSNWDPVMTSLKSWAGVILQSR